MGISSGIQTYNGVQYSFPFPRLSGHLAANLKTLMKGLLMSVSRRRFLQRGALTAAACASIPLQGWAAGNNRAGDKNTPDARNDRPAIPTHSQGDVLAHLDRDSFASVIGSGFKVSRDASGKDAIWLRLLSITGFAQADVSPAGMAVAPKKATSQPTTSA